MSNIYTNFLGQDRLICIMRVSDLKPHLVLQQCYFKVNSDIKTFHHAHNISVLCHKLLSPHITPLCLILTFIRNLESQPYPHSKQPHLHAHLSKSIKDTLIILRSHSQKLQTTLRVFFHFNRKTHPLLRYEIQHLHHKE